MRKILFIFLIVHCTLNIDNCFCQGWVQQYFGFANPNTSVFFIDENTGWITTSGSNGFVSTGSVLKTINGGVNWLSYMNGNVGFTDIKFINNNTGWLIGNYFNDVGGRRSYVYKSTNGGNDFVIQFLDSLPNTLNRLSATGINNVFVLRYSTTILSTSNSGLNWTMQTLNTGYQFVDMQFLNENTGYLQMGVSSVFKTTNAGNNWQMVGGFGKQFPSCFYFLNEQTGWVPIPGYNCYKTTNGGTSWNLQSSMPFAVKDVFFANESSGWLCGNSGTIQRTTNSGVNWFIQISGGNYSTITLQAMHFLNQNTGWAVGWGTISPYNYISLILKTTNGGVTYLTPISTEIPNQFSLSQNYPNPFNPNTIIRFKIKSPTGSGTRLTTLKVFDLLGREVATLVNEQLQPGTYEVDWDGSGFASGIYYYKIITADFTQTKKMVLIK